MPEESHDIAGEVQLSASVRLVFSFSRYQGRRYAHARKFISTKKYSGATPAGIAMTGEPLTRLVAVLRQLAGSVPPAGEQFVASVAKSKGSEFRVGLVPPDAESALPSVDIREYIKRTAGNCIIGLSTNWKPSPAIASSPSSRRAGSLRNTGCLSCSVAAQATSHFARSSQPGDDLAIEHDRPMKSSSILITSSSTSWYTRE